MFAGLLLRAPEIIIVYITKAHYFFLYIIRYSDEQFVFRRFRNQVMKDYIIIRSQHGLLHLPALASRRARGIAKGLRDMLLFCCSIFPYSI